jgi:hypothetical protein
MTWSLIALLSLTIGSNSSVTPRQATDELLKTIPREVAAVAILEDIDGFITRLERSEVVKRLRQAKILNTGVEAEVLRRWKELDQSVQSRVGVGLETLRKEVFGLSIALAYWPKNDGETGLFLVRARSADSLEQTLQALFRLHGSEPPRRNYSGVEYWTSKEGERQQFLVTIGPIGLLTDDEEAVRRVIQTSKGAPSWAADPVFALMRKATPTGALVTVFILSRNLDAKLNEKPGANPGEAKIHEAADAIWKSIEWVSMTAQVETELGFGMHASVDRSKLPPALARETPTGAGRIPTQGLTGTIASYSTHLDVAWLADLVGRIAVESDPKDAAAGARFLRSMFMGIDPLTELAPQLGPRVGFSILEDGKNSPAGVFGLELRPTKQKDGLASQEELIEQALRFAALVLTFEADKKGDNGWRMRVESVDGARVHVASGGKLLPAGVEPCFTVHGGWIVFATSPEVLKRALTEKNREVSTGEFGRLDLKALRRIIEPLAEMAKLPKPERLDVFDSIAEAAPLLLLKSRTEGKVHHWTMELPAPK